LYELPRQPVQLRGVLVRQAALCEAVKHAPWAGLRFGRDHCPRGCPPRSRGDLF